MTIRSAPRWLASSGLAALTIAVGSTSSLVAQTSAAKPMMEFSIDSQVDLAKGSRTPRFPDALRTAGVSGSTAVMFVVDTLGLAEVASLKVLRSDHDLFTDAVKSALPDMRFQAARVGARHVKQLVQVFFRFRIEGAPTDTPASPVANVRALEVTVTAPRPR